MAAFNVATLHTCSEFEIGGNTNILESEAFDFGV